MAAVDRDIDGLRIAMVGDLRFGRTIHSLSKLLMLYENIEVALVSQRSWLCRPSLLKICVLRELK